VLRLLTMKSVNLVSMIDDPALRELAENHFPQPSSLNVLDDNSSVSSTSANVVKVTIKEKLDPDFEAELSRIDTVKLVITAFTDETLSLKSQVASYKESLDRAFKQISILEDEIKSLKATSTPVRDSFDKLHFPCE